MHNATWFNNFSSNINAPYRLFTFPFAGGGSSIYRQWPARLPGVELMAVNLPGREMRIEEAPFDSMDALMAQLLPEIAPLLDRPFSFFGHSMGALTAWTLARHLAKAQLPQPDKLFLSAFHAPHVPARRPVLHKLPDLDFLRQLIRYGGIPGGVLESPELLRMVLPTLRADFSMIETCADPERHLISSEIVAFCGEQDAAAPAADMLAWREQTRSAFSLTELPGGHFFLKSAQDQLLQLVDAALEQRHFAPDFADLRRYA
ncbi:MAG TPA: putative thioesterase [Janthinobacterium sp.]|nr:putative thioesterase [Janthinobacterium sp.]